MMARTKTEGPRWRWPALRSGMLRTVLGKLYLMALIAFAVWYGRFIYPVIFSHDPQPHEPALELVQSPVAGKVEGSSFEEKALQRVLKEQKATATTDLGYTVVKEQYVKGHFHHIGMTVESDESNVCVRCHGAVPHDKSKSIRAFLNMHAFYLACETCHIKQKPDQAPWTFRWYDKANGRAIANPPGLISPSKEKYGNYGAKLAPGIAGSEENFRFLNDERERTFVAEYLKNKDALTSTDQSKIKKVIHRMVEEKPVLCENCHTAAQAPYLPFADIGYPPRRIRELTNTEVVGMVQKYREFYIPNLLSPSIGAGQADPAQAELPATSADSRSARGAR